MVCQCSGKQAFPMGFWHCLLREVQVMAKGGLEFFPSIQIIFSSVCKNFGKWLFTGENGVSVEGQTECRTSSWSDPSLCSVEGT